jgi:acetyl/propionyl-CoA carboxylase alpha subunit
MSRAIRRHYAAGGGTHDVDLTLETSGRLHGHVEGREVETEARVVRPLAGGADVVVAHDGGRARAIVLREGDVVHVALRGRVFRLGVAAARAEGEAVREDSLEPFVASPMTGVVRQVVAEAGKSYAAGATLVVVEAMKMEFAVEAPRAVVVASVEAKPGDRVDIGHVLVRFSETT